MLLVVSSAEARLVSNVVVRFDPPTRTVNINDVFTVDLIADITTPVVGWGLDVGLSVPAIDSISTAPAVVFPPCVAATAADGDGLVDGNDIQPFLLAMIDGFRAYHAAFPALDPTARGDFDGDFRVGLNDLPGFLAELLAP